MDSKILFLMLALLFLLFQSAYGQGVITFDDDFFERASGKVEGRHPHIEDDGQVQFGCTSVVGDRESRKLQENLRVHCRGDVRRLYLRRQDQFVSFSVSADTNEYFDVCCLPRGSRYQKHRWK